MKRFLRFLPVRSGYMSVGRRTLWPANTLAVANHREARERIAVHVSLPSVHGDSLRPKCSPAKVFAGQSVAGQRVPRRTDAHGDSLRGPHGRQGGNRLASLSE
uniref:Uncharacterized protein n=1 Tax=Trichuris muris TaxID=70415 RepID=A0A5S6Q4U3_TRIMR